MERHTQNAQRSQNFGVNGGGKAIYHCLAATLFSPEYNSILPEIPIEFEANKAIWGSMWDVQLPGLVASRCNHFLRSALTRSVLLGNHERFRLTPQKLFTINHTINRRFLSSMDSESESEKQHQGLGANDDQINNGSGIRGPMPDHPWTRRFIVGCGLFGGEAISLQYFMSTDKEFSFGAAWGIRCAVSAGVAMVTYLLVLAWWEVKRIVVRCLDY